VYTQDTGALYWANAPRNLALASGNIFAVLNGISWNGQISQIKLDKNYTSPSISNLLPGQYRIRFSALKHFGNDMEPDDYEVYLTPKFNLVF